MTRRGAIPTRVPRLKPSWLLADEARPRQQNRGGRCQPSIREDRLRQITRLRSVSPPLAAALVAGFAICALAFGASRATADDRFGINGQILFWSFPQSTVS